MKRNLILFCLVWMMGSGAFASVPSLALPYNITAVDALTNGLFRLIGTTHDSSWLGYGAPDVATNDYVIIQSATYGDIDLYRISNIWSQAGSLLICDVAYAEAGTPRAGQPEPGNQEISRDGYLYSTMFGGPSEYLHNGARNLFYYRLYTRVGAVETGKVDRAGDTMAWLTVNGTLTAKGATVFQPGDVQAITNGGSIGAVGTYVRIYGVGGAAEALGTPQITAGTTGQILTVQGTNNSNIVTVTNGNDLVLNEGVSFTFGSNAVMQVVFNGNAWVEMYRCAGE